MNLIINYHGVECKMPRERTCREGWRRARGCLRRRGKQRRARQWGRSDRGRAQAGIHDGHVDPRAEEREAVYGGFRERRGMKAGESGWQTTVSYQWCYWAHLRLVGCRLFVRVLQHCTTGIAIFSVLDAPAGGSRVPSGRRPVRWPVRPCRHRHRCLRLEPKSWGTRSSVWRICERRWIRACESGWHIIN